MRLEAEKRKVEDDLEAERALGVDKDTLLERSKNHELELEAVPHRVAISGPRRCREEL